MPPPGCRVFAGFLADHGPHNIANVPALLPSYIALAAVLTDRNNELNFRREEMLRESMQTAATDQIKNFAIRFINQRTQFLFVWTISTGFLCINFSVLYIFT